MLLSNLDGLWARLTSIYCQYPLSAKIMKPASNPEYYVNLMKELDEAPKRSWSNSVIARWKGFLRFS